ncbi:MAG: carboxypeptidase regulatory-like domain-containing protein [Caldilineaceae bacterium]|nr:carboxypeptidase regulatory-like domain-containing protein [Caldilineaceae bacterium]
MRRIGGVFGLSIVVGLFWTLGLLAATGSLAQSAGGSIAGIVTDEAETPLAGMWVVLYHLVSAPEESPGWDSVGMLSDPDGRFRFEGLADGVYRLSVEHYNFPNPPEYDSEFYDNKNELLSADDIHIDNGNSVENLILRMRVRARIAGHVYDEAGAPLAGIRAVAFVYEANGDYYAETAGTFRSDAIGQYTISGLLEGIYRVRFQDDLTRFYRTEFYDNAPDLDSGTDISVAASSLITGIDAHLAATGGISGVVTDKDGLPLEGMNVSVYGFWGPMAATNTGPDGSYVVYGLETGIYRVAFADGQYPPLYVLQYYSGSLTLEAATDISVALGLITPDINMQMERTGSIGGRITGYQGDPLANARISALLGERQSDGTVQWKGAGMTQTDGDGLYRLSNLMPGAYLIHADPREAPFVYLEQFYLDAATIDAATSITLTAGQELDGIDLQLLPAQRIAGRVSGPEGQPLQHICPTLWHIGANGQWQKFPLVSQIETNLQGEYRYGVIPDGSYRLGFRDCFPQGIYASEYYSDVYDFEDAFTLELGPKGYFHDVDARLELRSHIKGRVTNAQGEGVPDVSVAALYQPTEGPSAGDWIPAGSTTSNSDGFYDVGNLEQDTYRLLFNDTGEHERYLTEYYDNAYKVEEATSVPVGHSETITGIDIVLTYGGWITGKATNGTGAPVGDVIVSAWRLRQELSHTPVWVSVSWDDTDAAGRYTIRHLEPGIYRVLFDDSELGRYAPQYFQNVPVIEAATDVQVQRDSGTPDIDATLSRATSIAGKLTDGKGKPAAGVVVAAYQWITDTESRWLPVRYADSDAQGTYFLGGLGVGIYRVGFAVTDFQSASPYVAEYYNDAPDIQQAKDITLTAGQQLQGINASLSQRPTIEGRVTDESDTPLPNIALTLFGLYPADGQEQWILRSFDSTDETGHYSFTQLLPGLYRVSFGDSTNPPGYRSEFYDDVRRFSQATSITATAGAVITGVNARLASFAVNTPPVAHDDMLTIVQGQSALFPSALQNDEDADGDPLSLIFEIHPTHGSISFVGEEQMSYSHNGGVDTADFFTYRASDGVSVSNVATATITIQLLPVQPLFLPFLLAKSEDSLPSNP